MPGDPTDYLYIILGENKYYRLRRDQIVSPKNAIPKSDSELIEFLTDLNEKNTILADIESAPGESNDSCVCIALNIGYLDLDGKASARPGKVKKAAKKTSKKKTAKSPTKRK